MHRAPRTTLSSSIIAALSLVGCHPAGLSGPEQDLGRIEATLDPAQKAVWPGNVRADGTRYLRMLNGFFDGEPTAYWFAAFASKVTADVFWFCREGDKQCPLDDRGSVDRNRTIGNPVFSRVPHDRTFSPFWLIWVVHVPEDYQADELKSVEGIEQAVKDGRVRIEQVIHDHGAKRGPDLAIMHCLVLLEGTELENNGRHILGKPDVPSRYMPVEDGWNKQYRISFVDFSTIDGVFAPDPASESRPLMPTADIFVHFRDCEGGLEDPICALRGEQIGAVSERGIEADLTGDGDKSDNNNVISGFPRMVSKDPLNRPYSPLWLLNRVPIVKERDREAVLIDRTGDQNTTMIKDSFAIRRAIMDGLFRQPEKMSEAAFGNFTPGNDGVVHFNCPSQAPLYQ